MPDSGGNVLARPGRVPRRAAAGPRKTGMEASGVAAAEIWQPAICYFAAAPDEDDIAAAKAAGFNAIGLAQPAVLDAGLPIVLDLDITLAPEPALLDEHPDWFAHGARFFYLAENDAAVAWWDERIAALQADGISAFRCLAAAAVPAGIWARLIKAAKARDAGVKFMAWTPGAAPDAVASLFGCSFDFSFSSSCWWDFSAGWLAEDAARIAGIGPAIALAVPLDAPWPDGEAARRRALTLAAVYGAGWMMPNGFSRGPGYDLTETVTALNALRLRQKAFRGVSGARVVSSAGAPVALILRESGTDKFAAALNASLTQPASLACLPRFAAPGLKFEIGALVELPPGGAVLGDVVAAPPIALPKRIAPDCTAPRIAIEAVTPKVDDGQFPVRRIVGDVLDIAVDIIADGHDKLAAEILWRAKDEKSWRHAPLKLLSNDRWVGKIPLARMGRYGFVIAAWRDSFASFVNELTKKHAAGVPVHLEIQEGLALVAETAKAGLNDTGARLKAMLAALEESDDETKREVLLSDELAALMRDGDLRKFEAKSGEVIVDAERRAAAFANWYEIFPRSQSGDGVRHGNFRDVITQLPRIAGMGFDVLYFPPIHPIGRTNRKGRNNTLTPAADDPGSPYAIGAVEGGHDAIHPELGEISDFHALRDAAAALGVELALDFAVQCAPDHPWLRDHKGWFDWRPDGTIRYAENPPKKYEDIVNVDFYAEDAKPGLWLALRDVVQYWVDQGVRLFRVDNPHTKPLPFWEWLIADIRGRHPDAVFLAEAFTKPKLMYRLAKIGFSQSYTYFTWRNTKAEFTEYLTELTTTAPKEFFRPHFFVNTPDINPVFLHNSGRAGFLIRAALAATLSGLWGVYNGFELCESTPVAPGKEDYLDSEKYQLRAWDYERPGNIVAEVTKLNRIRASNAALHSHLGIEFHNAYNDQILYFSKTGPDGNVILVAISLDPFNTQTADIEIPLWNFGLPDYGALEAEDLMRDFKFTWRGKLQTVVLHPDSPFCIWRISKVVA